MAARRIDQPAWGSSLFGDERPRTSTSEPAVGAVCVRPAGWAVGDARPGYGSRQLPGSERIRPAWRVRSPAPVDVRRRETEGDNEQPGDEKHSGDGAEFDSGE